MASDSGIVTNIKMALEYGKDALGTLEDDDPLSAMCLARAIEYGRKDATEYILSLMVSPITSLTMFPII